MNEFKNDETLHEDYEVFAEKISRYSFPAHAVILITGATGLIGVNLVRSLLYANRTRHLGLRMIAWCRSEEKARKIYGDLCGRSDLHLV
ncbi:MAG: NAD(P)-dependent oxidoreductase, partial [Erysipelotrichaceae bacterium]|nr:NAD(P)-dependent oxidoreductase [Erysipelotrichaceae bacterium]